jgi:hypothetical protein
MEVAIGERHDALSRHIFGPYDRGAVAHNRVPFQRQDRERARRQEMLLGMAAGSCSCATVVTMLDYDSSAVARNAGALADVARAVSRDQEARGCLTI